MRMYYQVDLLSYEDPEPSISYYCFNKKDMRYSYEVFHDFEDQAALAIYYHNLLVF